MAWVQKSTVTKVREGMKILNKEYGIKTSVAGTNSHSLKLRIVSGKIDFLANRIAKLADDHRHTPEEIERHTKALRMNQGMSVNHYWLSDAFDGIALEYLEKAKAILMVDHWDKSDIQSDYFNCAYYINMDIGSWDKPYEVTN